MSKQLERLPETLAQAKIQCICASHARKSAPASSESAPAASNNDHTENDSVEVLSASIVCCAGPVPQYPVPPVLHSAAQSYPVLLVS